MPGFDGTGPAGQGPTTGGGRGYCAVPLAEGAPFYFGRCFFGMGRGRGKGLRKRYSATGLTGWQGAGMGMAAYGRGYAYAPGTSPENEIDILKEEADLLKSELSQIESRIAALRKSRPEKGE